MRIKGGLVCDQAIFQDCLEQIEADGRKQDRESLRMWMGHIQDHLPESSCPNVAALLYEFAKGCLDMLDTWVEHEPPTEIPHGPFRPFSQREMQAVDDIVRDQLAKARKKAQNGKVVLA